MLRFSATWTWYLVRAAPLEDKALLIPRFYHVSSVPGIVLGTARGETAEFPDCAGDLPPKCTDQSSYSSPPCPGGLLLQTTRRILSPRSSPRSREAGVSVSVGPFRKPPGGMLRLRPGQTFPGQGLRLLFSTGRGPLATEFHVSRCPQPHACVRTTRSFYV